MTADTNAAIAAARQLEADADRAAVDQGVMTTGAWRERAAAREAFIARLVRELNR